jgi:catechol 2,3-dioxygenase-like lactoylglutathione lyase family enzyme
MFRHVVLTVASIEVTCDFYVRVFGMRAVTFGERRRALVFGSQKINLHQRDRDFEPKALAPVSGSADLCFIVTQLVEQFARRLTYLGIAVEEGRVRRTGATTGLLSVFLLDPDGNLLEASNRGI